MRKKTTLKTLLVAALLGLSMAGCDWTDILHYDVSQIQADQAAEFISVQDPDQLLAIATNLMANEAVQNAVNQLLANESLVSQLTNFWPSVSDQYQIPDETNSAPSADGRTELPAIGKGVMVTGYGPVNYAWQMSDQVLADGLAYMQSRNVRYFIWEYVGNAGEDVLGTPEKLAKANSRFLFIQAQCAALGIYCAPILFNDNAGDGDYSTNGSHKLADRMSQAKSVIDFVAANADPRVCRITAVSEIQTSAGEQLESYALAKFKAAGLVQNYNGSGKPSSMPSGYSGLRDMHVCDINSWPPANTVWMNDCGASIRTANPDAGDAMRAMSADGTLYGAGNVPVIEATKTKADERGQWVFTRYGYQDQSFDKPAIDALSMPFEQTPNTDTPALDGSILPSQVKWLGSSFSTAAQQVQLSGAHMSGGKVYFTVSGSVPWPPQGDKKCKAIGFLIRKIGDAYVGGKIEWCVVERGWYDAGTNARKLFRASVRAAVRSGYNGATVPADGEIVWVGLGSPDGTYGISNLIPVPWKG